MPTNYTAAQEAAIACVDKPLQIIACAGSGKTQVISQRIANLLRSGAAEPRNIVAFTFTEKAAAELKDRVLSLVTADGRTQIGLAEMYIGTMHAFCLGLLKDYVPETFKFGTLTAVTSRLLIDRNSKKSGLTTCPTMSAGTAHLKRFTHSSLYLQVLSVLREEEIAWGEVPGEVEASLMHYLRLLREKSYLDYTSMLQLAAELLESDEPNDEMGRALLDHVRDDVRYVVVDEYQDTNPLQERLINALVRHGANLCVVGDDDQTIYQWRGSAVRNIIEFADRHDDVEQVTLDENFRSSEGVVELGHSFAARIQRGNGCRSAWSQPDTRHGNEATSWPWTSPTRPPRPPGSAIASRRCEASLS
ncbi:UvrD-helicase domain-containing protein [Piscicoccus intestinalis]|uniref:UvrD-helicase domain-containing protein n=1 Tax=Piscicoccus intestinalis TaxID=746033 RepID=UPI000A6700D8|nr:UvrD-helicase domain-containing protein [Piscicoccus intestinalis]